MPAVVINAGTPDSQLRPLKGRARGLEPRDFRLRPVGSFGAAQPFDLPLIPESEWEDRLKELVENKAQLSDIRDIADGGKPIRSLDQGNQGYCWAHSPTSCMMLARAKAAEPYVPLSAYATACIIKNYRNQGGFNAEAFEFIGNRGCPSQARWPQGSKDRSNDNPETWRDAAKRKAFQFIDLDPRDMKRQLVTCLLLNIPVASDFMWWLHSVASIDLVSVRPFRTRILNSWSDGWGERGTGILEGNRAIPDAAIACRVVTPSES